MNLTSALKHNKNIKILDLSFTNINLSEDAKVYLNLHPCLIKLDLHESRTSAEDLNLIETALIKKSVKHNLQNKKEKLK